MADTIEALLQENLGKVQDLHQVLVKVKENVDATLVPIDKQTGDYEKTLTGSIDKMYTAKEVLGVLDSAFATSSQEIDGKLDQLETQCEAIIGKIQETDKTTDGVLANLDTGATKLEGVLDQKFATAETELRAIRVSASQLNTLINQKMNDLTSSSKKYSEQVEAEYGKLKERYTSVITGFDTFATTGAQMMDASKQLMDTNLAEIKQELESVRQAFSQRINSQIQQAAAEEAAKVTQEVKSSIADVKQQVDTAHQQIRYAKDGVETEATEVSNKAEQAAESMGEAETGLERIKVSI